MIARDGERSRGVLGSLSRQKRHESPPLVVGFAVTVALSFVRIYQLRCLPYGTNSLGTWLGLVPWVLFHGRQPSYHGQGSTAGIISGLARADVRTPRIGKRLPCNAH